jgi:rhamnose transport system ATP-binding protein
MAVAAAEGTPTLQLRDVSKAFGPVIALRSGSLTLYPHSIHALVGENGAGKSTLVKIIAGLYQRDSGTLLMEGQPVDFKTTAEAKAAGIAVIYQEPTLFPDLSVTENVFMGRQPTGRLGRIDRKAMRTEVRALMGRLGVRIDPDRPAEGLSIADQQIIEIAKAISLDAKVLIMDEPTAALSGVEVERLFTVARGLRDEGRALMFISHRFDEVFDLCDTITVMRDGAYISTDAAADTDVPQIVRRMVGRDVSDLFPKQEAKIGDPLLKVENLNMPGVFHDISFTVRSGEIVGLAGLVGAGRSEVARAVFGVDPYESGRVTVVGQELPPRDPSAAMERGLALVPEDRRKQGLVIDATVSQNITAAIRDSLSQAWLDHLEGRERRCASVGQPFGGQDAGARCGGRNAERWQSTEGRAREVAGHHTEGSDHRRADPWHRCRHEGRGAPDDVGTRRAGTWDLDDFLGAAGGARHGRPSLCHAGRPHHRRA